MPQNIQFYLPFPKRVSPDLHQARERNIAWVQKHGLAQGVIALQNYRRWALADFAAQAFPEARGSDLDICADLMGWFFPFDDQFDGPVGCDPKRAEIICNELTEILYRPLGAPTLLHTPVTKSFADLWARIPGEMGADWVRRTTDNWAEYLTVYAEEARNRRTGTVLALADYIELRRKSVAFKSSMDLVERTHHFEVPERAYRSRMLHEMLELANDVIWLCNDTYSIEKEEARQDPHSIILIIERENNCLREESLAQICALVREKVQYFLELKRGLPAFCIALGLDAKDGDSVARFVAGLGEWMRANHDWGTSSGRYSAEGVTPADQPGYPENLVIEC